MEKAIFVEAIKYREVPVFRGEDAKQMVHYQEFVPIEDDAGVMADPGTNSIAGHRIDHYVDVVEIWKTEETEGVGDDEIAGTTRVVRVAYSEDVEKLLLLPVRTLVSDVQEARENANQLQRRLTLANDQVDGQQIEIQRLRGEVSKFFDMPFLARLKFAFMGVYPHGED